MRSQDSTPKRRAGRTSGFKAKSLIGLGLHDQIAVSFYGDIAVSKGGALCRKYLASLDWRIISGQKEDETWRELVQSEFTTAVVQGNSRIFREIAGFLEAKNKANANGPRAPAYFYAARFRDFCETSKSLFSSIPPYVVKSRTLVEAWNKNDRFRPSVREIQNHLDEMMGPDDAPDYKTIERITEIIGAKDPSKSSGIVGYRQFWQ